MRNHLTSLVLVGLSGMLLAATRPAPERPPVPPLDASEALNYSQQLLFTVNEVVRQYIRPVTSTDLAAAALSGLYEAAGQPVPRGLAEELSAKGTATELSEAILRHRLARGDVEPLRGSAALLVSFQAMTRALDPHCAVLQGEELRRGQGERPSRSYGLEVADNGGSGPVLIEKVHPGGPAQRAGLRPGDLITQVNGKPVEKGGGGLLTELLVTVGEDAEPGDDRLGLLVRRPGPGSLRQVTLRPEAFHAETVLGVSRNEDNSWNYFVDRPRRIAHVRLAQFGDATSADFSRVIDALLADGLRGLVLDLRWCPGGYLREAVNVSRMLLKEGTVATVKYRFNPQEDVFSAAGPGPYTDFPIVVLVNGDTSGGAELVAAALQDNRRAIVFGQRTVGKASVQSVLPLPIPNSGLKLTTGNFVRPNGKAMHRFPDSKPTDDWGIRPDPGCDFPMTPDLSHQLRDWWQLQTLRPGRSTEALPLDDPEKDPQRNAAVQALLKRAPPGEKRASR